MNYREPEEQIFNSECAYCYEDQNLCLCLYCDFSCCLDHIQNHSQFHNEFVIKPQNDDEMPQFCKFGDNQIIYMEPTEEMQVAAALILDCPSNQKYLFLKQINDCQSQQCGHYQHLIQLQNVTLPKLTCSKCDLTTNIWMCATCGQFSCGRKQYDGTGGNGHALIHYQECQHPVAVKITSLCEQTQEIYCYQCDDEAKISFEEIKQLLTRFGIEGLLEQKQALESSLSFQELIQDRLMAQIKNFDSIKKKKLSMGEIAETGQISFMNSGNTCYANSIINALISVRAILSDEFPIKIVQSFEQSMQYPNNQIRRILNYKTGSPNLTGLLLSLKSYFTNSENIGRQQDASEFMGTFFNNFTMIQNRFILPNFAKTTRCQLCGYQSVLVEGNSTELTISCNQYDQCTDVEQGVEIDLNEAILLDLTYSPQGCRCPGCKYTNDSNTESAIIVSSSLIEPQNAPQCLIVKANRLCRDQKDLSYKKLHTRIINPEKLVLTNLINRNPNIIQLDQQNTQNYDISSLVDLGIDQETAKQAMIKYKGNVDEIANEYFNDTLKITELNDNCNEKLIEAATFEEEIEYELTAVVNHLGANFNCGHYICLVKNQNCWIECNDNQFVKIHDIEADLSQGILYFYRKV